MGRISVTNSLVFRPCSGSRAGSEEVAGTAPALGVVLQHVIDFAELRLRAAPVLPGEPAGRAVLMETTLRLTTEEALYDPTGDLPRNALAVCLGTVTGGDPMPLSFSFPSFLLAWSSMLCCLVLCSGAG